MAINKNNVSIQITLSTEDNEKLSMIQNKLSKELSIDLSKSQAIGFLIKTFMANVNEEIKNDEKKGEIKIEEKAELTPPTDETEYYKERVKTLKEKLNKSFTELADFLGIPTSTLKKYASGQQKPSKENKTILLRAFKTYGIL